MSMWHERPLVVIDFETTGPDPAECMPVQVGLARFERGELTDTRSELIHPGIPIPAEATAVHGITDEDVADARPAREVLADQLAMIWAAQPVGYNGQAFDRLIWERFAAPLGTWIDPLVMVRHVDKYVAGKGRHRLEATCKRWGVRLERAHDALSDCIGTGELLLSPRMREALGDMSLEALLDRQETRRAQQEREFQAWLAKQPPREAS